MFDSYHMSAPAASPPEAPPRPSPSGASSSSASSSFPPAAASLLGAGSGTSRGSRPLPPTPKARVARSRACFFARVADRSVLDRVEFYAQDLQILSDLGLRVHVATRVSDLRPADLFFAWWWTWAFFPVSFARSLGRPSIVTGVFDGWLFPQRPVLHRGMMRAALGMATANVFLSELEMSDTCRRARVTNPSCSPLATYTDFFTPSSTERSPQTVFSVISNGATNARRKCAPELLEAAAMVAQAVPGVRFAIAGDQGPLRSHLEELARSLGISDNVGFLGTVSRAEKHRLMSTCAVYLQPSRYEGFGLAILEAMSCGAPVVASSAGAVPEVAGDAIRYVDGHAPDDIAAAVVDVLRDDGARRAMSAAGRSRAVEHFSYERRRHDIERVLGDIGV